MGTALGRRLAGVMAAVAAFLIALPALAQEARPMVGEPHAWAMGLQEAGGPVKEAIHDFNQLVLYIIIVITVFVAGLLGWCMYRYREARNPTPSRTSHHTVLEVAWTVLPVLILLVIAIPSFRLIYYQDRVPGADLTINVQGRQWYWHYAYPDHGNFAFDSYPVPEDQLPADQRHLYRLAVDNPLVVPVGANVRVITTGQDVIHSFFVPSLGVQKYTIPGRTLETWFRADRPGTFYGQCNQICGQNHWFMPIVVRAVPQAEFQAWAAEARTRFAREDGTPTEPAPAIAAAPDDTTRMAEARR
ncbi:cytochrome c oxidase subunit II [Plastoroseomonas hellenica]|uniref:cytochrome c oxidase subunit II n=1 Tax=Plastoroseomonas hellenica TaxID=2687306 RepID=UPI001BA7903A|nr:cytochrome c oxidase subunit II [Plastoroseomonas hellenica]MBR0644772.1 cytochrome c oxidase subunit II [Plastoroseomonas hellenica]